MAMPKCLNRFIGSVKQNILFIYFFIFLNRQKISIEKDLSEKLKPNYRNKFEIWDIHQAHQSKRRSLDLFLTQLKIVILLLSVRSITTLLSFRYTKAFRAFKEKKYEVTVFKNHINTKTINDEKKCGYSKLVVVGRHSHRPIVQRCNL